MAPDLGWASHTSHTQIIMTHTWVREITNDILHYTPSSADSIERRLKVLQNTRSVVAVAHRRAMEAGDFCNRLSHMRRQRQASITSDLYKVRRWFRKHILTDIQLGYVAETLLDKHGHSEGI